MSTTGMILCIIFYLTLFLLGFVKVPTRNKSKEKKSVKRQKDYPNQVFDISSFDAFKKSIANLDGYNNWDSYENHCWKCGNPVSSKNSLCCPVCGWYICNKCNSCEPGCNSGKGFLFVRKLNDHDLEIHRRITNVLLKKYGKSPTDTMMCMEAAFDADTVKLTKQNRNATIDFDDDGKYSNGYDIYGCNPDGFDLWGYDYEGFDKNGFNKYGYDREGYDHQGYNKAGIDREGYNKLGLNRDGYRRDGYSLKGFNKDGISRDGTRFDENGYDCEGYDENGYNRFGLNRENKYQNGNTPAEQWIADAEEHNRRELENYELIKKRLLDETISEICPKCRSITYGYKGQCPKCRYDFNDYLPNLSKLIDISNSPFVCNDSERIKQYLNSKIAKTEEKEKS